MAIRQKLTGPAIISHSDLLADDNPALFQIKIFQPSANTWYVEVYNRRTQVLKHTTLIYLDPMGKQAALYDARAYMDPYLKGLEELT